MHYISNCMRNLQYEVWHLINQFKVFNMKYIPRTCNTSTDMFKHSVKLEDHSDLWGTLGRTWTYEVVNEDSKSLWQKRRKILLSPKLLVKIKLNKLLVVIIIVSFHA